MGEWRTASGPGQNRRLLGTILVDGAFVSQGDLGEAIERQRRASAQLGGILVGMGVLNELELEAVLSVQREFDTPEDAVRAAAGVRELLGELLVRTKRLTPESLGEALAEQDRTGEKLGEILIRRGLITASELEAVLAFQQRQGEGKTVPSPLRLGELLVRTRMISRDRVEEALRRQKLSKKQIGEILVDLGYLKPEQVAQGLKLQQKLLTAALAAALSFTSVLPARAFDLPPSRTGGRVQIAIETVVKARTEERGPRYIQKVIVSEPDREKGVADLDDPSTELASRR
ncbi:MAG: hypothetical protein LLG93_10505 [Deltaproteobacteria bacterium]|nr:hypothetical protein [Deltaproteobacteria bacterium]